MNSSDPKHPWSRLTTAARSVADDRDATAPYGFATRVVARAFSTERKVVSIVERLALRAVGVACLLALASVAVNFSTVTGGRTAVASVSDENESLPNDDAVSVVLDLTD